MEEEEVGALKGGECKRGPGEEYGGREAGAEM